MKGRANSKESITTQANLNGWEPQRDFMFPMLVQPLSSHGGFDSGAMGRISLLKRGLS